MYSYPKTIAKLAEMVVADFVNDVDPDEVKYPDPADFNRLQTDLQLEIQGAIDDWLRKKKGE